MISKYSVYVPFDLETGGLISKNNPMPPILEIACCPFDNTLKDLKEYESGIIKIYDDRTVNQGALDANGITREQIENGRDSQEVADEFVKYLKSLSKQYKKIVLVGQNINSFDIPILIDFLEVHGYDIETLVNTDFTIDTLDWGHVKHLESANYKLGTLCNNVNIDLSNAHRAIYDTRATKELVKNYISSLRGEGSNYNSNYKRPKFEWK